jgi:hypothetical protein
MRIIVETAVSDGRLPNGRMAAGASPYNGESNMRLIAFHKLLIASTIVLAVVLSATRFARYSSSGDPATLAVAVGALVAIPVLATYLRWVYRRYGANR